MKNISKKTTSYYNPLAWLLAFLLSMSLLSSRVNAQNVTNYPFSNTSGSWSSNVITAAGGATLLTSSTASTDDDITYSTITIPFNFYYAGGTTAYNYISVNSNGYMALGTSSSVSAPGYSTSILSSYYPYVAFANNDLQGAGISPGTGTLGSNIYYQTLGTSPNRVFVVQYNNWSWYSYSTSNKFSAQVRFYEGSTGQIKMIYGGATTTLTGSSAYIGMNGTGTSNYSMVTGSSFATATMSTTAGTSTPMTFASSLLADSGRTFTWGTPPSPQVIDSVSTIQVTGNVPVGGTSQAVIGVVYYTHGGLNPKVVTGILCNTTGTTSTSDISNAKMYYTGNSSTFTTPGAAVRQFGSTTYSSPSGAMYFTSSGDTLVSGNNYYWLVYDITSSTSSIGNVVDGQCTLVVDSISRTPNVTNPAGNRMISGPMNGTYTINPSGSGTNNFTSFAAAIAAMNSNTINGPVTFLVSAATYTQSTPLILSCVNGSSATNTVTFDGGNGNASTRIITGSLSSRALVYMTCNYYTIRNLTIANTASGSGGVGVVTGTVGNTINNCIISTGSNSSTSACVFTATSTTDYYGSGSTTVDSLTIDSNTLSTAYYGITLYGSSSTTSNRNFKVRYNTISNIYYMGMYLYYIYTGMDIIRNSITMSPSYGYYAVYDYFCQNGSTVPTNFIGNKIMGAWGYSCYIYYPGGSTSANQFNFYNNWIIGANNSSYPYDYYGLYLYNSNNYNQIYHNTVLMPYSYTSTSYSGMYLSGNSYFSVKNNVIVNTASSGSAINLYCGTSIGNDSVNYNVYWNSSNSNLVYNGGTYGTSSTFNTASNGGDSSVNMLPVFVNNASDLHLASGCSVPTGADLTTFVPTDIDGNTRPVPPRRGASEANFLTLDMAMNAIITPVSPVGTGSATVSVRIQNRGTTTVTSAVVGYQFNGGSPVTMSWSGSLPTCASAVVTFSTPVTLISTNTLKVYTASPNGGTDLNRNNDTIISTINASMAGGTYTINGSSPTSGTNFQTFAAAVSAMGAGILGPVVFNVASGTYTQSTALVIPVISGASATNTITFEGGAGNASTRIITGNISSTAVVYIGSPYVTFHNLTINNTYTSNSGGIGILATAKGCKISNCAINLSVSSTTSSIVYTATSTTDYYGSGSVGVDSITIDSNTMTGGYYGIYLYGTSSSGANRNFKIRNNTITNPYYMGVYLYYIYNNIDLIYNRLTMSTSYGYYGVYMYYCQNGSSLPTNVVGNKIMNAYGYSFYCYYPGGSTAANTFRFYNNMIIGGNSSYPYNYYGLYLYNSSNYNQIYHNTVLMPYSYSSTSYSGMYLSGNSYFSVKNNIIVNNASSGSAINLYCGTSVPNDSVNFNVYYNKSNANLVYNGGTYGTSSTFNTTSNGGDSSYNIMPSFVNVNNDLHLSGPCSVPTGQNLTYYVPTDIDGITRGVPPRIGSSEPSFFANDLAMDSMTSPIPPITSGVGASITVRFKNVGSTPIYSALLYYSFNGATPVAYSWSGTLATCATATVTFGTGITLGSVNSFKVYTALPNGSTDPNRSNDTLLYNYFTPLSGTYTINASAVTSGTNFRTFTDAINTVTSAGMAGPVVFNVLAGTYNEQPIVQGTINGLSAVNTLTFDGGTGNAATRIVTFAATGQAVFLINQVKYVAIRNLTVTNSVSAGTAAVGIGIVGTNLSYNVTGCSIVGCIVNVPNPGGTSSTGYGITVTGAANGNGTSPGIGADSITIDSNIVNGGGYGIACIGSSNTSYNRGYRIRYNQVTGANYMGAYIYTHYNPIDFIGNHIHMNSSYGYYGVYFYYNQNSSTTQPTRFNGNTIDNYGGYGIYFYYPGGTATAPVQFYNNLVLNYSSSYGGYYGLANYYANYMEMYNNTMIIGYNGGSTSYTNILNYVTNLWCKNNIFGVASGSSATPAYFSTNPSGNVINYNDYYNLGTTTNLLYRSGFYSSSTYLSSSAGGDTSYNFTPAYISPSTGNYGLANNCSGFGANGIFLNSSPWTGYSVGHDSIDILGVTRSIPLTLGAYQFNGTANDLAVVAITSPTSPISSGSQPIKVRIGNTGTTTIYTTTMVYKLNGGTPVTLSYTNSGGGLAPCVYDTVTFTGVTLATGNNTLKIWSSLPNSTTDGNRNNDTINATLGTPMSGTYTINLNTATGGTNYQTFDAAIVDLNNRGVSGACTFNVTSGNYYPTGGSLTLGNPTGVSATNTITFKSAAGVPDSVIVNGNGSGYIVTLNATQYVSFKALSFVQPSNSGIFNFTGGSSYDMVYNCKLTAPIGTSGNLVNMTSGFTNNVTIRRCNLYGDYYGVYLYNSTNWNYNITIDSNTIGAQYMAAYMYYSINLKFKYNNVTLANGPYTYGYCYMLYCDSATEFAYNNISTPNSGTYAYVYAGYYSVGSTTQHVLYHDNKIDAAGTNSYIYFYYPGYNGSYIDYYNNYLNLGTSGYVYYLGYYSTNVTFYNNTVISNQSYTVYYYNYSTSNMDIENNVFYNTGTGYPFYYAYSVPGTTEILDNNVYYSPNNATPIYQSGGYSVANWKVLTANSSVLRDKNSLQYSPGFTNATMGSVDMSPNLSDSSIWSLNGRGKPVSWINHDISGNARSTSVTTGPTDIGCYEFTPSTGNIPPLATPSSAPTAGATQTFTFAGDVVASIAWPSSVTVPTSVGVRVYPQSTPPQLGTLSSSWQYTAAYWNVTAYPSGTYSWAPTLNYKDHWMRNIPSKSSMVFAGKYAGSSWASGVVSASVNDTVNDLLAPTSTSISSSLGNSYLVGTTTGNPLPVQMASVIAVRSGNNGLITWITASEINSDYFVVERSFDGINFSEEGSVKAAGNSVIDNAYNYTDLNVVINYPNANIIYYRIKTVDMDGSSALSGIVSFKVANVLAAGNTVYPNPFINELNITVNAPKNTSARVEIFDIQGRLIAVKTVDVNKGDTKVTVSELANLNSGIYFVNMTMNGETIHAKVIKN